MLYRTDQVDHGNEARKVRIRLDGVAFSNRLFVFQMAESVDLRMDDVKKGVYEIRRAVLTLFAKSPIDMQIFREYRECCALDKKQLS